MNDFSRFNKRDFEAMVWRQTKAQIEARVRAVRCPEHGGVASVHWTRGGGDSIPHGHADFEIRACCDRLAQLARSTIGGS